MIDKVKPHFYLKLDKIDNKRTAPLYLRVTVNGKRFEISLNERIKPEAWNKTGQRLNGRSLEVKKFNEHLNCLYNKIIHYYRDKNDKGKSISANELRNFITGIAQLEHTIISVFEYHLKQIKEKLEIDYAPATLKRYDTTLRHIKQFLAFKYNLTDIPITDLDFSFVTNLEHYFKVVKNCNNNTTIKYIRNLRKVINISIDNEWLDKDPFAKYRSKINEVKRDFLTQDEVNSIDNKFFGINRLDLVKDIFIFSCYTGLAFVDVEKLTTDNVQKGIDGNLWLNINRTKTDTNAKIPLLDKAINILDKYKYYPENVSKGKLLPVTSNQKMNGYLKEIADICGINKKLTFHLARHTFATTITLTNGVPIESVSKMLGHKSIKTTQIYAKVTDEKVGNDMKKLKEIYNQNSIQNNINQAL